MTSAVLPVCDGCGRARVDGRRRHGVEGGRWCQRCYQNARVFTCRGCGEDKRVATAARDEDRRPARCADCVAGDEDLDRLIAIACHVADTEPDLAAAAVIAAVVVAAPSPLERSLLADNLGYFPGSLTSGASSGTRVLWRLIVALEQAGATVVVRPRCADCGRARELVCEPAWSERICAICRRQRRAEPCGRCEQLTTVHRRTDDLVPLCRNCWNRDPDSWQVCVVCKVRGRINARDGQGRPICTTCYHQSRPHRRCDACQDLGRIVSRKDGHAWCENCYQHLRPQRRCGGCGRTRPINKRACGGQPDLCAACNWAPIAICSRCNNEAMCRRAGQSPPVCLRCRAIERLDALLTGPDGHIAPVFAGVREAFLAAHQPRSLDIWLDRSPGAPLLARLAAGQIALDHAALDQLEQTPSLHHLRQLLIACGALPERDPHVASIERAIGRYEATLTEPGNRRALRTYGTWHELARLRRRWPDGDTPPLAAKNVNAQLIQASYLLRHLETNRIVLADLTQADLDRWLTAGAGTRTLARSFVTFATRRGLVAAGLEIPIRRDGSTVTPLDDQQRWALARRLLHDDTLDPADRVVGSLIVLYAQPVTRIARLTVDDVHDQATHLTISFGKDHVEIPEPLAGLLRQLPWRRQIGPSGTVPDAQRWLFPGRQAGRHIHPDHLRNRMIALGVPPRAARHAAMLQLAREVPAAVLADILGIAVGTATAWTARAGGTWHHYAAQRVRESEN